MLVEFLLNVLTSILAIGVWLGIGFLVERKQITILDDNASTCHSKDDTSAKIYTPSKYGKWSYRPRIKRSLDSIFIDQDIKSELVQRLGDLEVSESWHATKQIPYRLGILLHGKPGDGKTSLISAIADHFGWDIYNLSITDCLSKGANIPSRISAIPRDRINLIVIEDLDFELSQLGENYASVVPNLLSIMDGLLSHTHHVLFVTATLLDNIPDEFKREGRFDLVYHITPPTKSIIIDYFQWFYLEPDNDSDNIPNVDNFSSLAKTFAESVPDGTHMCEIQNHLRKHRLNPHNAITFE